MKFKLWHHNIYFHSQSSINYIFLSVSTFLLLNTISTQILVFTTHDSQLYKLGYFLVFWIETEIINIVCISTLGKVVIIINRSLIHYYVMPPATNALYWSYKLTKMVRMRQTTLCDNMGIYPTCMMHITHGCGTTHTHHMTHRPSDGWS